MQAKTDKQRSNKWILIVEDLGVGTFVAVLFYIANTKVQNSLLKIIIETVLTGAITLLVVKILRQGRTVLSEIESLSSKHDSFEERMYNDERIIFARPEHSRSSRISVVLIEDVPAVPSVLNYSPQCEKKNWARSISLLRFDRIQDLLLSRDYLEHFFSLGEMTDDQTRILIVNDRPRSKAAVKSFLQISRGLKIRTYIYRKSEFYGMLDCVRELVTDKKVAQQVREILEGNPELSLMLDNPDKFKEWTSGVVTPENDYLLRYLAANGEVLVRGPGELSKMGRVPFNGLLQVFKLMFNALHQDREGMAAFERVLAPNQIPENHWSRTALGLKVK